MQLLTALPNPYRGVDPQRLGRDLEAAVNRHRERMGLQLLTPQSTLAAAAKQHSQRMRNLCFFDHTDPADGSTALDRVSAAGGAERWRLIAENLAAGQWSAEQVLQGWLSSAGHRANLERRDVQMLGTAVVSGGSMRMYITQLYASAESPAPFPFHPSDIASAVRSLGRRLDVQRGRCIPHS